MSLMGCEICDPWKLCGYHEAETKRILTEVKVKRPVKSDYTARVWMADRRRGRAAIAFADRRKKR